MKNHYDNYKNFKIVRPVKKYDIHSCLTCPSSERTGNVLWLCVGKDRSLDYNAIKMNIIPEWCPLEDY